jgi:hypothetical protein
MTIRKRVPDPQTGTPKWGTSVEIVDAKEPISQFVLADGTVARLKLVVLEAFLMDEPGPDSKPAYTFNTQLVANIHPPEATDE